MILKVDFFEFGVSVSNDVSFVEENPVDFSNKRQFPGFSELRFFGFQMNNINQIEACDADIKRNDDHKGSHKKVAHNLNKIDNH